MDHPQRLVLPWQSESVIDHLKHLMRVKAHLFSPHPCIIPPDAKSSCQLYSLAGTTAPPHPLYASLTPPSLHLTNPLCLRSPLLTAWRLAPFHDSLTSPPPPPPLPTPYHSPEETHFLNPPPTSLSSPVSAIFIPNSQSMTHFWTFCFLDTSSRSNLPITNFPWQTICYYPRSSSSLHAVSASACPPYVSSAFALPSPHLQQHEYIIINTIELCLLFMNYQPCGQTKPIFMRNLHFISAPIRLGAKE